MKRVYNHPPCHCTRQSQQELTQLLTASSSILTSPLKRGVAATQPSLVRRYMNYKWLRDLVRQSASCSFVGTYLTANLLLRTWSRTKWTSRSMCLVRAWKTGLDAKAPIPILSHQRTGVPERVKPSSPSNFLI